VRQLDQFAESLQQVLFHPQVAEVEVHSALVQQTEHHALAVDHGDDRDANVHLPPGHLKFDPPILRQTAFGDVQPRHDLQAADDRVLEAADFWGHGLRVQHAVDAVADHQARLLRLDVYVAGPRLDGLQQYLVDQTDDRRFLGHFR